MECYTDKHATCFYQSFSVILFLMRIKRMPPITDYKYVFRIMNRNHVLTFSLIITKSQLPGNEKALQAACPYDLQSV